MRPKFCVLKTSGINCDDETAHAFNLAGADAEIVHLNTLRAGRDPATGRLHKLSDYQGLAIPGGFSHGDYVASGVVFARDLVHFLQDDLKEFHERRKPIIGICNGAQVLAKARLLPQFGEGLEQTTTLTYNECGRFRCAWTHLVNPNPSGNNIWTKGIEKLDLPNAHGEGRFVASEVVCRELFARGLVSFQYADNSGNPTQQFPANPNGSMYAIAGIHDMTGTVFALMPHPERYTRALSHPQGQLQKVLGTLPREGQGLQIFRNAVEYAAQL